MCKLLKKLQACNCQRFSLISHLLNLKKGYVFFHRQWLLPVRGRCKQ